ncbi:hypothetical protein ACFQMA_25460 [Halosimplex aquaticum]|uniref:Uncharacterized protein n=1 Tax=Halosimplex aquaticum TaxID=3026162 RepID=A0ABD5Y725_9EURY
MSEAVRYEYGTSLCSVQENRKLIVEECDRESIKDELRAANFVREGSKYVKKRPRLRIAAGQDAEEDALQVLSVRLVDNSLHVKPSDIVGIVSLVPGMNVQIEPKVDWEHVIEMLLTVYDIDRTQSYYGVPLSESSPAAPSPLESSRFSRSTTCMVSGRFDGTGSSGISTSIVETDSKDSDRLTWSKR